MSSSLPTLASTQHETFVALKVLFEAKEKEIQAQILAVMDASKRESRFSSRSEHSVAFAAWALKLLTVRIKDWLALEYTDISVMPKPAQGTIEVCVGWQPSAEAIKAFALTLSPIVAPASPPSPVPAPVPAPAPAPTLAPTGGTDDMPPLDDGPEPMHEDRIRHLEREVTTLRLSLQIMGYRGYTYTTSY